MGRVSRTAAIMASLENQRLESMNSQSNLLSTTTVKFLHDRIDVDIVEEQMEAWPTTRQGYVDLLWYLFFILVFIVMVSLEFAPGSSFYLDQAVRTKIGNGLDGVMTLDDWWKYIFDLDAGSGGILDILFENSWYNGQQFSVNETAYVLYYNKLVGGVLLSQQRGEVTEDGCVDSVGPTAYSLFYKPCYLDKLVEEYSPTATPFSSAYNDLSDKEKSQTAGSWTYSNATNSFSTFFSLSDGRTFSLQKFATLKKGLWVDGATRQLRVQFALFNPLLPPGLFSFCDIVFPFDQSGAFRWGNHLTFQSINMEPYRGTANDVAKLVLEIIFLFSISKQFFAFVFEVAMSIRRGQGISFWLYVDACSLTTFIVFIGYQITALSIIYNNPIVVPTNVYPTTLQSVADIFTKQKTVIFVAIFIAILRALKYMEFQPRLNVLNLTLANSVTDLIHFFITFCTVFAGFGFIGHILFGTTVRDFSSFGTSLMTLLRTVFGDFDYPSMEKVRPDLVAAYFVAFNFFVTLLLMNVLIGIIVEAYMRSIDAECGTLAYDVAHFFQRIMYSMVSRHGVRDADVLTAIHSLKSKGKIVVSLTDLVNEMRTLLGNRYGPKSARAIHSHPNVVEQTGVDVFSADSSDEGERRAKITRMFEKAIRENTLLRMRYRATMARFVNE